MNSSPEALSTTVEPSDEKQSLKRLVFSEVPLENGQFQPIKLDTMESVAILAPEPKSVNCRSSQEMCSRRDYGVNSIPFTLVRRPFQRLAENNFDLLTLDAASRAAERLDNIESLAGMVSRSTIRKPSLNSH